VKVVVAIPCLNEAATIAKVVRDFRAQLPDAEIVVFDNGSGDGSEERAREAGARVVREKRRGKGHVMQAILEKVDADLCLVVDGDDTYFAEDAPALLDAVREDRADMAVGNRFGHASREGMRELNRFGNHVIIGIINLVFRTSFRDVLSGFRVMNRSFLTAVPLITGGFETETELTLQALSKDRVIVEIPVRYRARPTGSHSKLSPFADGYRILITIAMLLRNHRPLYFFSVLATTVLAADLVYAVLWALGFFESKAAWLHGGVTAALLFMAMSLVVLGVVLNAVQAGFRELSFLQRRNR